MMHLMCICMKKKMKVREMGEEGGSDRVLSEDIPLHSGGNAVMEF